MRRAIAAFLPLLGLAPHLHRLAAQVSSMRVTVPSPTAASLGKFGDIPVSLYTGTPDISIPLFTAKGKTLELPIVLKYHAAGIKVEEIGSWAGLGWTLEAGGSITRTVRGLADESPNGYYYTGATFSDDANWPDPPFEVVQNIKNEWLDGEPDRFFFSFAGRSGQFVMGPTTPLGPEQPDGGSTESIKEYRAIPHQALRIVPTLSVNEITRWDITTEDGTRYTFAAAEATTDESTTNTDGTITHPTDVSHNSSWHLTEIRSPGGDVITLHYSSYPVRHLQGYYTERFDYVVSAGERCVPYQVTVTNKYEISLQRLDSITAARHTVRFTTTTREDALSPTGFPQEERLDRISIHTPSGTELRRFQFEHTYVPDGRLRLTAVSEQDPSGAPLPPYTFTYDQTALPERTSYAVDHWGYYNGKTENTTPIPAMIGPTGSPMSGADRSPDSAFTRAGVLTRITYPTGGYNEFVYEVNDYGAVGASGALPVDAGPEQRKSVSAINQSVTDTFTVGGTELTTATVTVMFNPECPQPVSECSSSAGIVGVETWVTSGTYTVALAPDGYTLFAEAEHYGGEDAAAMITIRWRDVGPVNKKLGAGLRVAEVRTGDALGNTTTRRYKYTLESDTLRSSGAVAAEPRYHYSYPPPSYSSSCSYSSRSSMSKMPLGEGPVVGYREVTVWHGGDGEYGKTRHTFRSVLDAMDVAAPSAAVWPFSPSTSMEWKRGQPIHVTEYDASGQVQRRTASSHRFRDAPGDSAKALRGLSINVFSTGSSGSAYLYHSFQIISAWPHPAADTTYVYDEGGSNAFSNVKTYAYDNPRHLQPTAITETNSDGTTRITRMTYPADYAPAPGTTDVRAAALTAMQGDAHIHNAIVERWVIEKTGTTEKIVQAELTTFKDYGLGRYLPFQRFVLNSPSPLP